MLLAGLWPLPHPQALAALGLDRGPSQHPCPLPDAHLACSPPAPGGLPEPARCPALCLLVPHLGFLLSRWTLCSGHGDGPPAYTLTMPSLLSGSLFFSPSTQSFGQVCPPPRPPRPPLFQETLESLPLARAPGLVLKLSRTLWGSWAWKPFCVPCFLFVGNRLQPP